jgi:iron complex outermembrane receptor protein
MKHLFFVPLWLAWSFAFCQNQSLNGTVQDESSGEKIPGAVVSIENSFSTAVTDYEGKFEFKNLKPGNYHLVISHISYERFIADAALPSSSPLEIKMKRKIYLSDEVTIAATRVNSHAAVAYTNINKEEIEKNNLGQDIPYLLNLTPSVVVTSDAGTGVGYTGIRIRGTDATRVNVTINGVPVNGAEDHTVYWVDLPDLASSVDNIQIQRGAGTSTNGVGAFGGSVNIQTSKFSPLPFAALSSSYGSFNTWKNTVSFGTGLLKNENNNSSGFSFDGRLSKITSDGYIDRATSDLKSLYLSGGYYSSKSSLRFVILSGKEKTYQSWYGVPEDSLRTNRTFNPAGMYFDANGNVHYYENQTDNYQQDYYQLLYSRQLKNNWDLNFTAFLTKGKGYYEEYQPMQNFADYNLDTLFTPAGDTIAQTDLIRQKWLDNDFYGMVFSANKVEKKWQLTFGGAINQFNGDHFNDVIWAQYAGASSINYRYFNDDALKTDLNLFGKLYYDATNQLHLFADLQLRALQYQFRGFNDMLEQRRQQVDLSFFNPKVGISYEINNLNSVYASVSTAAKEPVRDDYVNSTPASRPKPEYLTDIEAGYKYKGRKAAASINFYLMDYKDQLALTGQINDVGEYTRKNITKSSRTGVEAEAGFIFSDHWNLSANATLSSNKIESHSEFIDNYDDYSQKEIVYNKTDLAFSPSVIAAGIINYLPVPNFTLSLQGKYVGKQFLDNTSNEDKAIDAYFINDLRLGWKVNSKLFKEFSITLLVNNLFDKKYVSNGYTFAYISGGETISQNYYFPQAGRNFLAGITMKF